MVVDVAGRHGLNTLLASSVGTGATGPDLLRLSGIGAASANAVDNLPAYLALEPVADARPPAWSPCCSASTAARC